MLGEMAALPGPSGGGGLVVSVVGDPALTEVSHVTHRSAQVGAGGLFCCLRGRTVDGHQFASAALNAGATALLCERPLDLAITQVVVEDSRRTMAMLSAIFHGHPSHQLSVVGITGTNGKTTTAALLAAILQSAGRKCEVVGTLSPAGGRGYSPARPAPGTTPESSDLQELLAVMRGHGTTHVALEVSSHSLVEHRVDAMRFSAAVFTNLSPEHLDYHGTMESYFAAKASLFEPTRTNLAVVNADDPWGQRLAESLAIPTRSFALADAVGLQEDLSGSRFTWNGAPVTLALGGRVNVANALAAAVVARELGVSPGEVAKGLGSVAGVPGRLERVRSSAPFTVLVDFAHTPAGLEGALDAARSMAGDDRVLLVFGCGGGRDRAKRPLMGAVASALADSVVVTSDNPRQEPGDSIIDQVVAGADGPGDLTVEPDRRKAVALALSRARPGDVVVIAGKGHETTQLVGTEHLAFDDRRVAADELEKLGW